MDIRSLDLQWLRAQVALVGQEPALFNGTILDNLKLGCPDATLEEVRVACAAANAVEFIERQPDKYGTLLGEGGGISLSGGQKQRIAIARAHCSRTPACCCWTRPRQHWIVRARRWCRYLCTLSVSPSRLCRKRECLCVGELMVSHPAEPLYVHHLTFFEQLGVVYANTQQLCHVL